MNPAAALVCERCGRALPHARPGHFKEEQDGLQLPVEGFKGGPEDVERQWFEQVYTGRGDRMRQLTLRAVLMGSALGGILSLTNIYVGLKSAWGFGVAITACMLSYAIWTGFCRMGLAKTPMTILENNCMQSTATAAGSSAGGTLVSAFAAYILLNNQTLSIPLMLAWVFLLAMLGVTMAIPMKRQMINVEQLRFPSGVAAAETLRALHAHGHTGLRSAKALGIAALFAAINKVLSEGLSLISAMLAPYQISAWVANAKAAVLGPAWIGRTVALNWDPLFLAAGAITGLRICASMLLGGVLCWMVFVPILQQQGVTDATNFRDLVQWTLWGGTSCMVTSGLLSVALQWRSVARAFRGLGALLTRGRRPADEMAAIEAPASWFVIGQLVALIGIAWLATYSFDTPYWQSALAVLLTFGLALVTCRVTGETDTQPVGAMGKIMQLTFGVLHPASKAASAAQAMNVNLMAANITAGAAGAAADLLTDLKSGYLLGANPRRQFIAQFCGIFSGTLVTVFAFNLLVPNAAALGTEQFPAPAAQVWRAVAEAMSQMGEGLFASLGPVKTWSIIVGGLVGIALPLLTLAVPHKYKPWIPSAAGIGLAWAFQFYFTLVHAAVFPGLGDRIRLREEVSGDRQTIHFPCRFRCHCGGFAPGGGARFLGERPGDGEEARRVVRRLTAGAPQRSAMGRPCDQPVRF
jgi:putative OPT family oligopeptide transporter